MNVLENDLDRVIKGLVCLMESFPPWKVSIECKGRGTVRRPIPPSGVRGGVVPASLEGAPAGQMLLKALIRNTKPAARVYWKTSRIFSLDLTIAQQQDRFLPGRT